ncbi:hypothetical protein FE782_27050 [Paenibacillus antri]|uniref:GNAT family N-acetyltransferase n=1 Tax=Paenibacillus antri TaxID=2582848 RepID=A0A5R9FYI1_9BACL|nr:hypothetical protein [Paenibacillus antri]TLS49102.1 hypothetical protein FE782_27050 [Paenibacillus antri]
MSKELCGYICREDSDFSRCMTFLLETRRTADPGLRTEDAYAAMLRVLTYGALFRVEDERGEIAGLAGYTIGSPHQEYEDREVAYVEYCLAPVSRHGTSFFLKGLGMLVRTIQERHADVEWLSLAAAEDHPRNNRLYSKFARRIGRIEHPRMSMNVYAAPIEDVAKYTAKFD